MAGAVCSGRDQCNRDAAAVVNAFQFTVRVGLQCVYMDLFICQFSALYKVVTTIAKMKPNNEAYNVRTDKCKLCHIFIYLIQYQTINDGVAIE